MTSFVLIAGVWINLANVYYFHPYKNKCRIVRLGVNSRLHLADPNCERLIKELAESKND